MEKSIIIVGGGIAGLSAGAIQLLCREEGRGFKVTLDPSR